MKPIQKTPASDHTKSVHNKSSRKSSKSRSKAAKLESSPTVNNHNAQTVISANTGIPYTSTISTSTTKSTINVNKRNDHVFTPPAPPATTSYLPNSVLEETLPGSDAFSAKNANTKWFVGLEPRSIKIIWEQHDQSDIELSREVCARVAEDASYKLWELISNLKTYSRHSGGGLTYDLVNEALRDCDVPPMLGAMDSEWDKIDYDGSYFFFSDKIVELREEYQKEVQIKMAADQDFFCSCPVSEANTELIKKYIPSLIYILFNADSKTLDIALNEAASSVVMPSCYRILLHKIICALAFKQCDTISERCWRFLRACAVNPLVQFESCRQEYLHLTEILVCQLLGPYEHIKVHTYVKQETDEQNLQQQQQQTEQQQSHIQNENDSASFESELFSLDHIKMDIDDEHLEKSINEQPLDDYIKSVFPDDLMDQLIVQPQHLHDGQQEAEQQQQQQQPQHNIHQQQQQLQQQEQQTEPTFQEPQISEEKYYRLIPDEDAVDNENCINDNTTFESEVLSPYFASPVELSYLDDLCSTIGHMGSVNGFFQSECTFHIIRRLERFFEGRTIQTMLECQFISRAVRGLISLGEYAFREFIPFIYKFQADTLPESMWNDFSLAATFLKGADDIYLYEWLEYLCGADKLQPFLVYNARYLDKLLSFRYHRRKPATYRINPKVGVRRLEWSTLVAAMCHGDDPNKALKPKPTMSEVFPELQPPINTKRPRIRINLAACKTHILLPKDEPPDSPHHIKNEIQFEDIPMTTTTTPTPPTPTATILDDDSKPITNCFGSQNDILIARRKLFKPLTNERRVVPLSSLCFTTI